MNNLYTGRQREVGDTLPDRSRLVKNAAVLRFFCARRAERIKYRRFSKSCKVSSTSLWLITLSFTILIAPHQFFYFRETFSGRRERTFFLTGFEKRRYLIFPALRAQKNLSTATFFTERERPDREKVRSLRPSEYPLFSSSTYGIKNFLLVLLPVSSPFSLKRIYYPHKNGTIS